MRHVRRLAYLSAMLVLALIASACTPALEPAKPEQSVQNQQQNQQHNSPESEILNPLEKGIMNAWKVNLAAKPISVTFGGTNNRDEIAVLTQDGEKQTLHGFSQIGDSLLEKWSFEIPHGTVRNLVTRGGNVYFNLVPKNISRTDGNSAESFDGITGLSGGSSDAADFSGGNRSGGMDLYALDLGDGSEKFRWSKLNPLDSAAPTIVGSYLRGLGVLKIDQQRITAAILDDSGKVTANQQFFKSDFGKLNELPEPENHPEQDKLNPEIGGESAESAGTRIYQFRRNQVVLPKEPGVQNRFTIAYPMLKVLEGDWCETTDVGAVCVQLAEQTITQYDRNGDEFARAKFDSRSAAQKYRFIGGVPGLQIGELFSALQIKLNNADSQSAEANRAENLTAAYLYGDSWLPQTGWKGGSNPAQCAAAGYQAPFCIAQGALVNVRTGKKVSAAGAVVLRGSGAADQTFFTYRDGVLAMLVPDKGESAHTGGAELTENTGNV